MTMRLKRVELSNIRSHEHVVFEPDETGVTAIKGPTGSGKSTIVDAVPWALFGTKPEGVSQTAEMFRTGSEPPEDKCYAKVDLIIGSEEFRVTRQRVGKGGSVKCDVEKLVDGEYDHVAGSAVSHAEPYIRKLLKMSEQGFLSAVFVQQKQVDKLILSGPSERGEIIERLTGIHGLTHSLAMAREDSGSLKKAVALSTIDKNTVDELRDELAGIESETEKLEGTLAKAKSRHEEAKSKLDTDEEKLIKLRKDVSRRGSIEDRLDFLVPRHDQVESSIEGLKTKRERLRERYLEASGVGDLSTAEAAAQDAREASNDAQKELHEVTQKRKAHARELDESKKVIESSGFTRKSDVTKKLEELCDADERLSESASELRDEVANLSAEERSLKGAKKALEKGEGTCPTCLQTARDPEAALREIDKKLDDVKNLQSECRSATAQKDDELVRIKEEQEKHTRTLEAFESKNRLTRELKDEKARERDAQASVKLLGQKASNAEKALYSVRQAASLKDDLDSAKKELEAAIDETAKSAEEIKKLKKEQANLTTTSESTLEKSESTLVKLRERVNELSAGILKIEGRLSVLEEKRKGTNSRIEAEEENKRRYDELLKNYEKAEASVSVISDFRQNRIDNSVPAIENLASLLLERFTDGLFVSLKLDAKFKVRVVRNDSAEFNVGLLSGGELSAAAMALRLAIGMLLSPGTDRNLLILDEVLTAQDANRSELILSSIRELYDGQVIIIAHNDSIDAIVDKVFRP